MPDDAEARLAAARQLHGERRADADAERLREADADLGLVAARSRRPASSGGSSKRVWSPGKATSLTGSPSAKESAPCAT